MIIVDTSGILASKDESHPDHTAVAELIAGTDEELLLSPFVLAEADYMLARRLGAAAAREFLSEVASEAYELVDFDAGDIASASGVIDRYDDLDIGIADASLVVIAARFQTTRVLTFDQRHFRPVAPLWGAPAFTVLPADA
ncbi:PIN domain-containing protein [Phytoactinopolyspora alkaliphila]|uniref:Ribonuclease VapC n=1 Tax=Phytoactinopolyspora alkaliphila TaxID=1783498 RepID=A0A6N9YPW3_9ACTN|nr:PIN domain-containing protein [Phytoactinopolyspora alkaliphila]NED97043.1 PIN domain-containing protein [Phytoactinopolyspora alkaliphila]